MKKKVLYGVFMALMGVFTMGTLQSCTDDLSDFEHQYVYDQYNLGQDIANLQKQITDNKAHCESEIERLEKQILANDGDIEKLRTDLEELNGVVKDMYTNEQIGELLDGLRSDLEKYASEADAALKKDLEGQIAANLTAMKELLKGYVTTETFNQAVNDANKKIGDHEARIIVLETKMTTAEGAIEAMGEQLTELQTIVANLVGDVVTIKGDVVTIKGDVETIKGQISAMQNDIQDLQSKYNQLDSDLDDLYTAIFGENGVVDNLNSLDQRVTSIYNQLNKEILENRVDIANLYSKVAAIESKLSELETELDSLVLRVDNLITSILLQATDSPVFGNFSLPIGVQANMLFNWYFQNMGEGFEFPIADAENSYNGDEDYARAIAQDIETALASMKGDKYSVPEGLAEVNLGKLYMTINPVGHNVIDGKTFYLETSKGEAGRLPFTITPVESDDELMFGYSNSNTRAAENGFYEAEVKVPASSEDIASVSIDINEDLKAEFKDLLKDVTRRNAVNFLHAIWDQVNGTFPQYAVRAQWPNADATSSYSVFSKYDLAVATAKPLGFKFLQGESSSHRLHIFGHIDNVFYELLNSGRLEFDFSNIINKEDLHIALRPGDVSLDGVTIFIEIDDKPYYANPDSMDEFREAIEKAIKESVESMNEDVNKQIEQIVDKIMADLENRVNTKIANALDQAGQKAEPWFARLNKLVDIYNRVAGKINSFLSDPNAYLQPAIFYKTSTGIGIVSQAKNDPTVFIFGDGETTFDLYPMSYTGDLVAPAYKKFVACVNVYDQNGNAIANGRDMAKYINSTAEGLATVLDGNIYAVNIPKLGKYTYEFLYQALDYTGVTSTKKFYIKVK